MKNTSTHLSCVNCGYDLHGQEGSPPRCPECGQIQTSMAGPNSRSTWVKEYLWPTCIALAVLAILYPLSEGEEIWDSSLCWSLGVTLMVFGSLLAGLIAPRRPWRWPLLILLIQWLCVQIQSPEGSPLIVIGICFVVGLALLCLPFAFLGAWLHKQIFSLS